MSTPLAIGQLLLGTADLPGVSSIASAVAESAAKDRIPWSALDYSGQTITAISGSAIGGQVDTSQFYPMTGNPSGFLTSVDLSDYAKESSLSSKLDASASSSFYPADNPSGFVTGVDLSDYAKESSLSAVSSVVSSIQEDVSSISAQVSGLTGVYLEQSASSLFAPSGDYLSATDSSKFYPMTGNPSSFVQSGDLSAYAKESAVSSKLDASASSLFAPSGDYAFNSSVSSKLDASASSLFAPSGDYAFNSSLSSYLLASASSLFMPSGDYQTAGDYAYNSAVSSKLDASASAEFYLTSNPSGFLTGVDLSPYQLTADMSAYQPSGDYAYNSSLSSKLDASASSDFYPTSNPSGFVTGVDLSEYQEKSGMSAYQLTADMSAYQPSGDYAYNSSLSSKLDASASSDFYLNSNPSGFITEDEASTSFVYNSSFSSYSADVNTSITAISAEVSSLDVWHVSASSTPYMVQVEQNAALNMIADIDGLDLKYKPSFAYLGGAESSVSETASGTAHRDYFHSIAGGDPYHFANGNNFIQKPDVAVPSPTTPGYSASANYGWTASIKWEGTNNNTAYYLYYLTNYGYDSLGMLTGGAPQLYTSGTGNPPSSIDIPMSDGYDGFYVSYVTATQYTTAQTASPTAYSATAATASATYKFIKGLTDRSACCVPPYYETTTLSALSPLYAYESGGTSVLTIPRSRTVQYQFGHNSRPGLSGSSFSATAQTMEFPLSGTGATTGDYCSIDLNAIISSPYGATWTLVETVSSTNWVSSFPIALARTVSGASACLQIHGGTYFPVGGQIVCTDMKLSATFDNVPTEGDEVTVHAQVGQVNKFNSGYLLSVAPVVNT